MSVRIIPKERQGTGAFNGGEIIENKPIGFPNDGGEVKPFSSLFYWAYAEAKTDSTIGLHPHQGFEIMSFVLRGAIRHFDTKLNSWRHLQAGDAQIIRAGNGISHAEHMEDGAVMFQIWLDPGLERTLSQPASYDDYLAADFPVRKADGLAIKTYVGAGAPMTMDTPGVAIAEYRLSEGTHQITIEPDQVHAIYVLEGEVETNGAPAGQDSFVLVEAADQITWQSSAPAKLFMISAPAQLNYQTYYELMAARRQG